MLKRELTFAVIAFLLVVPTTVFLSFVSSASEAQAGSGLVEQGTAGVRQLLQQQVRPLEPVPPNGTLPGSIDVPTGNLPTLEQVPPPRVSGGGIDISPWTTTHSSEQQGEPPLPVVCSEEAGLVKDPETGQCVPIVQPPPSPPRVDDAEQPTEEPEEQPDRDDQQPSEDGSGDSSEGNNNGDSEGDN
jgi:hypothetical protein